MANVKTYSVKTDGNMKLSTNFVVKEFQCKDGTDQVLIDPGVVKLSQAFHDILGIQSIYVLLIRQIHKKDFILPSRFNPSHRQ